MEEILRNLDRVRQQLKLRGNQVLTEQEFRAQCESYVVGNAFDVFSDSEVINRGMLRELAESRLHTAS
jgi:hypothetical protein